VVVERRKILGLYKFDPAFCGFCRCRLTEEFRYGRAVSAHFSLCLRKLSTAHIVLIGSHGIIPPPGKMRLLWC
jgi:hypothetical protein